jgi:hypothetical protein
MAWFRNPKEKTPIQSILIKIEKGQASENDIASLMELIDNQPSAVLEVIGVLTGILKKKNANACNSAIMTLKMVAENDLDLVSSCLDDIIDSIRRQFHEECILGSIDIMIKISEKYPERMGTVVSYLTMCLENISAPVRNKSYFLLAHMAILKPEVFKGHSEELARVLKGLNIDERIYACKLIKKIAEKDPKLVESTHAILEDLRLNHHDSNLRLEAAYAMEKLKVKENIIKQKSSRLVKVKKVSSEKRTKTKATRDRTLASDVPFSELADLPVPNEKELKDFLQGLGLNHLIRKS